MLEKLRNYTRADLRTQNALESVWESVQEDVLWNTQEEDDPDEGFDSLTKAKRFKDQELFDCMIYFNAICEDLKEMWITEISDEPRARGVTHKGHTSYP